MMPNSKTNITKPAIIKAAKGPSPLAQKVVSGKYLQGCRQMLSLACGIALDEAFMADHCDINILGVDQDDEILADAKKKETDRLTFMKHDVTQPFPLTGSFDCIYSRNLLHYFNTSQQQHILSQVYSLLKPKGLFIFQLKAKADYFYVDPDIKRIKQSDGMIYFPSMGYSRNHLDEGEVEELLTAGKFVIEELFVTTEYLYKDSHKSTLINCFAGR
ncbi:MAG: methyltransferase domain-containing protein [Desulforhopalus sp.]|nr:methyltransferase domain-containing protein [Desulforhopalus sp.]